MSPTHLLDTNVLSELARPAPSVGVLEFLDEHEHTAVSSITVYELQRGVELLPAGKRKHALEEWLGIALRGQVILALDAAVARRAAKLESQLRRAGHAIELRDLFIAATAAEHALSLATRNVRHFRGTGLSVSDPFAK